MKFESFEARFLGLPYEPLLRSFLYNLFSYIYSPLKSTKKKEFSLIEIILLHGFYGFCSLKIKITQFPNGFRLHMLNLKSN